MARTTVDDCLEQCPNHFDLAHRVSRRARDIMSRGDPRVPERGDKSIVVALREIADPNTLEEPAPPEQQAAPPAEAAKTAEVAKAAEAVVFDANAGQPPPSPDEPDPTDPMGERERERAAQSRSPDEPQPPDNID